MSTGQLVRRLRILVKKWPVDPSREGRDLGEFLRTSYVKSFEEQAKSNVTHAEAAVNSLERLVGDHHRKLYAREYDYSYSEGLVARHTSVLSNESQSKMKEKSRTVMERIMGRRKP